MRKINLNPCWEFAKLPDQQIESPDLLQGLSGIHTQEVKLPHTWFQDENQYRGLTVYRKTVKVTSEMKEHALFLEFNGADQQCRVYANGVYLGGHKGAYARFCVEIPEALTEEDTLEFAVFLSNEVTQTVSPIFGDFTVFGGLYRAVNLILAEKEHFDYLYYGTDGLIVKTCMGEHGTWILEAEPHTVCPSDGSIRYKLFDQNQQLVAQLEAPLKETVRIPVEAPALWNGLNQAALYELKAELCYNGVVKDEACKTTGFRSIRMDAEHGFFLNETHMKLNGVSMHQDFGTVFSAVTKAQMDQSFALIHEIGANALRLSHYQHPQDTYERCDKAGYVVWAEIPMLKMTENQELFCNARQQMTELILQNLHHPSICFWGIQNEIGMFKDAPYMHEMCQELYDLAKKLDDTRLVTAANLYTVKPESKLNRITDMIGYNIYFGWYYGEMKDYDQYLDQLHAKCPGLPLGVSEYGVDANPDLHSATPMIRDYSEEYQALHNETVYPIFESKEYMWGSFLWNLFDFSSFRREEGGKKYINQKGIVSYDRTLRKDAFYYYKAKWSSEPFLHICSKRYQKRSEQEIEIKVYTNLETADLYDESNSAILPGINNGNGTIVFSHVSLKDGENKFMVRSCCEGIERKDTVIFEKVEVADPTYTLPDSGAGQAVKNWFLSEDDLIREGYFSLKDSAYDILEHAEAMKVFRSFAPVTANLIEKEEGIPLGLSMLSILGRDKKNNPEFEMKDLNHALNQVKK